jgi:hypothetical protein
LFRRAAIVIRGGQGIRFDLAGGRVLMVTVDDADAGCRAARTWLTLSGTGSAGPPPSG